MFDNTEKETFCLKPPTFQGYKSSEMDIISLT